MTTVWTQYSNCYAYAFDRPDVGWLNPGWVAAAVTKQPAKGDLKDVFAVYAPRRRLEEQVRDFIGLFVKDGCAYLNRLPAEAETPGGRYMFAALCRVKDLYDYHCYRYEGDGRWSSKNADLAPRDHGEILDIADFANSEGFTIPLGFFKMPDLPQKIPAENRRALRHIKSQSDHIFINRMWEAGLIPGR